MRDEQRRLLGLPPLPLLPLFVWAACATAPDTSPGVSWALAQHRARTLSEIRYELTLSVPAALEERIHVLDEHPNYPERLRGKILQAADGLFRAAEMDEGLEG